MCKGIKDSKFCYCFECKLRRIKKEFTNEEKAWLKEQAKKPQVFKIIG